MRTVADVIAALAPRPPMAELPAPSFLGPARDGSLLKVALAVESMARHMTDEGWQIMQALEHAGYFLYARGLPITGTLTRNSTNVRAIIEESLPMTVVVQDKREWEGRTAGPGFDHRETFVGVHYLRQRSDIFKLTILKDAHQQPLYHRQAADEMGAHAWIVYYHPKLVKAFAPYVRERHLIRTWHTLDSRLVPEFAPAAERDGCLLSGAVSSAYPLRRRLVENVGLLHQTTLMRHPGYRRDGCATPHYLRELNKYKVAICTSSIYGYLLRKIVEATACGCIVVTDLPIDEVVPEIDANLIRVEPTITLTKLSQTLEALCNTWHEERQRRFAEAAKARFDFRVEGVRLADEIERLRSNYNV